MPKEMWSLELRRPRPMRKETSSLVVKWLLLPLMTTATAPSA
jgi:hypothetical protein